MTAATTKSSVAQRHCMPCTTRASYAHIYLCVHVVVRAILSVSCSLVVRCASHIVRRARTARALTPLGTFSATDCLSAANIYGPVWFGRPSEPPVSSRERPRVGRAAGRGRLFAQEVDRRPCNEARVTGGAAKLKLPLRKQNTNYLDNLYSAQVKAGTQQTASGIPREREISRIRSNSPSCGPSLQRNTYRSGGHHNGHFLLRGTDTGTDVSSNVVLSQPLPSCYFDDDDAIDNFPDKGQVFI